MFDQRAQSAVKRTAVPSDSGGPGTRTALADETVLAYRDQRCGKGNHQRRGGISDPLREDRPRCHAKRDANRARFMTSLPRRTSLARGRLRTSLSLAHHVLQWVRKDDPAMPRANMSSGRTAFVHHRRGAWLDLGPSAPTVNT